MCPIDAANSLVYVAAFAYVLVPSIIVLIYFSTWPAPVALASALSAYWFLKRRNRILKADLVLLCRAWPYLAMSALAVWLSGIIPPFAENLDWYKHYAIFNELTTQSWPPNVVTDGAAVGTLRYSLSYYVIPAALAKAGGTGLLYSLVFAWTTLGCFLALLLAFGLKANLLRNSILLGIVFFLFSGADVVGSYVAGSMPVPPMPWLHFEWWASFGELSSSLTSLLWTPQHAIAGWIAALLVLRYPLRSVRNAGLLGAAVALWSPFCAVGLVPTLLWAITRTGLRPAFSRSNLIVAPVLLIAAALYLTQGSGGIPFQFVWDAPDVLWQKRQFSWALWLAFVLLEFVVIAASIVIVVPRRAGLIAVHALFVFALCFASVGAFNDLLMRASIPSLGILAVVAADAMVLLPFSFRKLPLIVCIAMGAITPAGETMRAFASTRIINPSGIRLINIVGGQKKLEPQYIIYENDAGIIKDANQIDGHALKFATFGTATFDLGSRRVSSDTFTDAALVSDPITLPSGIYRLDTVLDWDVIAEVSGENAAHISLHGEKILAPIMTSEAVEGHISRYFVSSGSPFRISFGLGGWANGKGTIHLKELTIGLVKSIDK
ncbi:hypothetical protein AAIH46_09655 [Rhizobium sp. 0TCS1.26]|uniref:hypothetical protein n=1 Tax=Rhizobium sp. 0TCS1.26 TaxID=3142623 RepID=UPI003D2D08C5